jgi:hypothetical protein
MLLNKTALARDALQAGPGSGLNMQERRILIMTDGKRSLNEVMGLLGADILPAIDRLIRAGYIDDGRASMPATPPAAPVAGLGSALGGLIRAATESVQARTEQIRAGAAPARAPLAASPQSANPAPAIDAQPATRSGQRRSLVAAKMYLVDMLQLQRHPDAVELKTRIQCTSGEAELLEAILDGMRVLLELTNQSYGQRIVTRLREVLPVDLLPDLDTAANACSTPASQPERLDPPQLKVVGG